VPVFDLIRGADPADVRISNVVTIPNSKDGGPCADFHVLSRGSFWDFLPEQGLKGRAMFTSLREISLTDEDERLDVLQAFLRGVAFNEVTYEAPSPLGTCKHKWRPHDFQDPLAPRPLTCIGMFTMFLPWATITLDEQSNLGPYDHLFGLPSTTTDGPYTISTSSDFTVDGQSFHSSWEGTYSREAGRALDAVDPLFPRLDPQPKPADVEAALSDRLRAWLHLCNFLQYGHQLDEARGADRRHRGAAYLY
jgi:hypothetical protein